MFRMVSASGWTIRLFSAWPIPAMVVKVGCAERRSQVICVRRRVDRIFGSLDRLGRNLHVRKLAGAGMRGWAV